MKKLVVVADGMISKEELDTPEYHAFFDRLLPYDVETHYVFDDGLCKTLQPGEPFSKAMLRIEKEGPEWVEHSPEFLNEIKDANFIIVNFSAAGTSLLNHTKNLELLCVCRSGTENINLEAAKEKGIIVSNAPGRVAGPVADFTVSLILALNRRLYRFNMLYNNGSWTPSTETLSAGCMLMKDAVIGLIGYGRIGHMVIERLKGFGCKNFLAYDPFADPEQAKSNGVKLMPLENVMANSDFISIHARLTPETENLIGEKEIALMKPSAFLINTARAGLLDEAALITALQKKRISGAALDVFREEPLSKNSPLLQLNNVILTPHCAGAAGKPMVASYEIAASELLRYCKNEPLQNQII